MLRLLHSALWWLCNTVIVVFAGIVIPVTRPIDKNDRIIMRIAYFWSKSLIFLAGCKLEVEGIERLRELEQMVLICNHQSYFDIFAVITILGQAPHFLAKKELFSIPIFGYLLRLGKVLEIDRQHPEVAVESIKRALRGGFNRPVIIFPEGTRSKDGVMQPFKRKGITLLSATGLPFLPMAIEGSRQVMPKGRFTVRPGKIVVVIGSPIEPPKVSYTDDHETSEEFINTLWREVHSLQQRAAQMVAAEGTDPGPVPED